MKAVNAVKNLIKHEPVMCIAFVLAVASMLFVVPDKQYLNYIDFSTLCILFCLMTAVAGFKKCGVFDTLATRLLGSVKSSTGIFFVLILGCFFLSMFMTNDVALLTLVPFAILTLRLAGLENKMMFVIVLQTIAANLGSMLTPFGNPQNLYLYNLSQMSFADFILLMLPLTLLSLALVMLCIPFYSRKAKCQKLSMQKAVITDKKRSVMYLAYFAFVLLFVTKVITISWIAVLAVSVVFLLVCDRKLFCQPDYCLLLTFVFFFVFVGNTSRIDVINGFLSSFVGGNELSAGIITSQVISNVPAALLLSAFSGDINALIKGVDIGGLGTLIASMASLISYKLYAREYPQNKLKYLGMFTAFNVGFLVVLTVFEIIV